MKCMEDSKEKILTRIEILGVKRVNPNFRVLEKSI